MKLGLRKIAKARIACGDSMRVTDGDTTTIRVDDGCVWITEEGSFIDHVLVKGQRYTFDRPGLAIVSAHTDARVTLLAPRFAPWPARVASADRTLYVRPWWRTLLGPALARS